MKNKVNSSKIKNSWDNFWENSGNKTEWTSKDILKSKYLDSLYKKILKNLGKSTSGHKINSLELGAGNGIASLFFAKKGFNITLLDKSNDAKISCKKYWNNHAQHKFILADLFKYNPRKKYDIVSSFGLCEHFSGKERIKALKKHINLLNERGVAIISTPYKYGIFYRLSKKISELLGYWSFGLEVPFSKKEFIDFANSKNLDYELEISGFYSSMYDLFIRKPFKILGIHLKRRFDGTKSIFDNYLGPTILVILKKRKH